VQQARQVQQGTRLSSQVAKPPSAPHPQPTLCPLPAAASGVNSTTNAAANPAIVSAMKRRYQRICGSREESLG